MCSVDDDCANFIDEGDACFRAIKHSCESLFHCLHSCTCKDSVGVQVRHTIIIWWRPIVTDKCYWAQRSCDLYTKKIKLFIQVQNGRVIKTMIRPWYITKINHLNMGKLLKSWFFLQTTYLPLWYLLNVTLLLVTFLFQFMTFSELRGNYHW